MRIDHSVLLPYVVDDVFDVIERAEAYPRFVPWCTGATILERSDDWVAARLEFSYLRLRFACATRNAKRRPIWMHVCLVDGPFKDFQGTWTLLPLGDAGCKVDFTLSYEPSGRLPEAATQPVVARIGRRMVDAFVQRAHATLTPAAAAAPACASAAPAAASAALLPAGVLSQSLGGHHEPTF